MVTQITQITQKFVSSFDKLSYRFQVDLRSRLLPIGKLKASFRLL